MRLRYAEMSVYRAFMAAPVAGYHPVLTPPLLKSGQRLRVSLQPRGLVSRSLGKPSQLGLLGEGSSGDCTFELPVLCAAEPARAVITQLANEVQMKFSNKDRPCGFFCVQRVDT